MRAKRGNPLLDNEIASALPCLAMTEKEVVKVFAFFILTFDFLRYRFPQPPHRPAYPFCSPEYAVSRHQDIGACFDYVRGVVRIDSPVNLKLGMQSSIIEEPAYTRYPG